MKQKNIVARLSGTLVISLLTLAVFAAGCKSYKVESRWAAEPVGIDGKMTEWKDVPLTYIEKSQVQLGISNDGENLYVLFCFFDSEWARLIRSGGITVWLDESGKKRKELGLRYTGGPPLKELREAGMIAEGGDQGESRSPQRERFRQTAALAPEKLVVITKAGEQTMALSTDGSGDSFVKSGVFKGLYIYEFSIPLESEADRDLAMAAGLGKTVSLGFEWGSMSESDRKRMMELMGGRPGGAGPGGGRGGGMGPGGMGRGGMGPGGPGGSGGKGGPQLPEKQEVWLKATLAVPAGQ
ncbi:MAG: hypothetical protein AMJ46_11445 [Latescibacteria bacterium DG_63]|nr:MAG: hypothetical protein AMJ46_11445 [Latescibacteria bacterium DG_63]